MKLTFLVEDGGAGGLSAHCVEMPLSVEGTTIQELRARAREAAADQLGAAGSDVEIDLVVQESTLG